MFGPSQSMGYDRSSSIFSPEGRIIQTEYAREAMKRGSIAIALKGKDGVVLAGRLRTQDLDEPSPKIHPIDYHISSIFSGYAADGRILTSRARVESQIHRFTYATPIDIIGLATKIGDLLQAYTQSGGVRPFGVGLLFAGIDSTGPQVYFVNPGGGITSCKAKAIGDCEAEAIRYLRDNYTFDLTLEELEKLAVDTVRASSKSEIPDEEIEITVLEAGKWNESLKQL